MENVTITLKIELTELQVRKLPDNIDVLLENATIKKVGELLAK